MARSSTTGLISLRAGLILYICLIIAASLAPFWPLEPLGNMLPKLRSRFFTIDNALFLPSVIERFVIFFPFGFLVVRSLRKTGWLWAFAGLFAFCCAVEFLQIFIANRHPRFFDLKAAIIAAWAGAVFGFWWHAGTGLGRGAKAVICAFVIANGFVALGLYGLKEGSEIKRWDCDAPLLVGNEGSLNRGWKGRIRGLVIYDQALPADMVAALAELPITAPRAEAGAIAQYDFGAIDGGLVPPVGGEVAPTLTLPAQQEAWAVKDDALTLHGLDVVKADGARALCDRIRAAQAFSVEIEMFVSNLTQSGPARIVSLSENTRRGNFLLGQDRDALVLRVTTPRSGQYGAKTALRTGAALAPDTWLRAVASYEDGHGRIFIDGILVAEMHANQRIGLGTVWEMPVAGLAASAFFVLGAIALFLVPHGALNRRIAVGALVCATLPLTVLVVTSLTTGARIDTALLLSAVVCPLAGLVFAAGLIRLRQIT